MGKAHFIVSGVQGSMIAACGLVIPPRDANKGKVGIYGMRCTECESATKNAWVTFQ